MEITYDTGARVILQGPATYEVESANGGYLSLGKLTAKVEKKERGEGEKTEESIHRQSPSSLFSIRTPTAIVTDLGTEFGVEVGSEGAVEAQVFGGQIEFQPSAPSGRLSKKLRLGKDEVVRLDKTGTTTFHTMANPGPFTLALAFSRRVPTRCISIHFSGELSGIDRPVTLSAGLIQAWHWNNTHSNSGVFEGLLNNLGRTTTGANLLGLSQHMGQSPHTTRRWQWQPDEQLPRRR